jgi:hypothetical protein
MGKMVISISSILLWYAASVFSAVYYVDSANGNDTADGLTLTSAWETIDKANKQVQPGDTAFIRKGSYSHSISPDTSGTEQLRITYAAYLDEVVVLSGMTIAVNLVNRAYITVDGMKIEHVDRYVTLDNSHHIWIVNGHFDLHNNPEGWPTGIIFKNNSQYNWLHHCVIGRVGYSTVDDDKGCVMNLGVWENADDNTDYNLIEDNVFFYGGHHVLAVSSSYNIVRNNYFHNENWMECERAETGNLCGNRNIIFEYDPTNVQYNVIEGNRFAFSGVPPDQNTSTGLSVRTPHNIVRRNVFYHCDGPGMGISTLTGLWDAIDNHVYHNVYYHNGYPALPGVETWKEAGFLIAHHGTGAEIKDLGIKNNIFYDNKTHAIMFYYVEKDSQVVEGNWEEAADPLFKDITSTVDPFDPSVPDFHLQETSPCIDSGVFLTRVVSPDGSGTLFQVEDAGYFINGWGIIEGDLIQLEGSVERARITQVDYNNNTITFDQSLTWTTNSGVSLAYEGTAPDIGAFEYGLSIDIKKNLMQKTVFTHVCYLKVISGRDGVQIIYSAYNHKSAIINIYNLSGKLIKQLPIKTSKGLHFVKWDRCDNKSKRCTPGYYIAQLHNAGRKATQGFILFH